MEKIPIAQCAPRRSTRTPAMSGASVASPVATWIRRVVHPTAQLVGRASQQRAEERGVGRGREEERGGDGDRDQRRGDDQGRRAQQERPHAGDRDDEVRDGRDAPGAWAR